MTDTSREVDEFDLAGLDKAFHDAPEEDAPIPDGNYQVSVDRVELKRSKTSNAKMLEWELRLLDSPFAGRKVWKYTLLESAEHMTWAKRDIRAAGLELEKISDLPQRLTELLDVTLDVKVQTKGEFQAIYFRGQPAERPATPRPRSAGDRVF